MENLRTSGRGDEADRIMVAYVTKDKETFAEPVIHEDLLVIDVRHDKGSDDGNEGPVHVEDDANSILPAPDGDDDDSVLPVRDEDAHSQDSR